MCVSKQITQLFRRLRVVLCCVVLIEHDSEI